MNELERPKKNEIQSLKQGKMKNEPILERSVSNLYNKFSVVLDTKMKGAKSEIAGIEWTVTQIVGQFEDELKLPALKQLIDYLNNVISVRANNKKSQIDAFDEIEREYLRDNLLKEMPVEEKEMLMSIRSLNKIDLAILDNKLSLYKNAIRYEFYCSDGSNPEYPKDKILLRVAYKVISIMEDKESCASEIVTGAFKRMNPEAVAEMQELNGIIAQPVAVAIEEVTPVVEIPRRKVKANVPKAETFVESIFKSFGF